MCRHALLYSRRATCGGWLVAHSDDNGSTTLPSPARKRGKERRRRRHKPTGRVGATSPISPAPALLSARGKLSGRHSPTGFAPDRDGSGPLRSHSPIDTSKDGRHATANTTQRGVLTAEVSSAPSGGSWDVSSQAEVHTPQAQRTRRRKDDDDAGQSPPQSSRSTGGVLARRRSTTRMRMEEQLALAKYVAFACHMHLCWVLCSLCGGFAGNQVLHDAVPQFHFHR